MSQPEADDTPPKEARAVSPVRYHVRHETAYRYDSQVALAQHLMHLTPRACAWQSVTEHALSIRPAPSEQHWRRDYFGNTVLQCAVEVAHDTLEVCAESVVELHSHRPAVEPADTAAWETVRAALAAPSSTEGSDAAQFLFGSPHARISAPVAAYAARSFPPGRALLAAALELTARIHDEFAFDPQATTVATPIDEVLARRRGVCQDFAHLQLACLRAMGLAARYVSGYILTHPPPGQPRLIGADASHAWVSLWIPALGWVDLDPTNDLMPDTEHVVLAWGRDFADVSPLRGVVLGGTDHELDVRVTVTPLETEPAVEPAETA